MGNLGSTDVTLRWGVSSALGDRLAALLLLSTHTLLGDPSISYFSEIESTNNVIWVAEFLGCRVPSTIIFVNGYITL